MNLILTIIAFLTNISFTFSIQNGVRRPPSFERKINDIAKATNSIFISTSSDLYNPQPHQMHNNRNNPPRNINFNHGIRPGHNFNNRFGNGGQIAPGLHNLRPPPQPGTINFNNIPRIRTTTFPSTHSPNLISTTINVNENPVHNYSHLHEENARILTTSDKEIHFTSHPERNDLCSLCSCNQNFSQVLCEHRHLLLYDKKHNMTLRKELIPKTAILIQVRGYDRVVVEPGAFSNNHLKVKLIAFENIAELILKKFSLRFESTSNGNEEIIIQFRNCTIPTIQTDVLTQMEEGRHGSQENVQRENTKFLTVEFIKCKILKIEENALQRALLIYFTIIQSEILHIETRAIDLDVYGLVKIKQNRLPTLVTEALCFHAKKTVFSGNVMRDIHNHSMVIETDGQVLFEYNKVEFLQAWSLAGIKPMEKVYGASIVFLGNTVKRAEPNSLFIDYAFPPHEKTVRNNSFTINCECDIRKTFQDMIGITDDYPFDESSYINAIYKSQCLEPVTNNYVTVDKYLEDDCKAFPVITVSAVSAAVIFFIISVTVCVVCSLRIHQVKEEANVLGECTSQSFSTLSRTYDYIDPNSPYYKSSYPTNSSQSMEFKFPAWVAAVPEIKTYQQSHLPEFNERTESIRGSVKESKRNSVVEGIVLARTSCPFN